MKFRKAFLLSLAAVALLLQTSSIGLAQPLIVTQPQDQTNLVGTVATFSVNATGTPPLTYQWSFGTTPAILDGATNQTLLITNVQVANRGPYQVIVTNVQGAVTSSVATLYVVPPAIFQFTVSSYSVSESAGTATLVVKRSGDTNQTVTIDYATSDGTATNGIKYKAASGSLTFEPGVTNRTIAVQILNEGFVEGTKYFRVMLSNPSIGARLGAPFSATVPIADNDFGTQFQFAIYSVSEDAGAISIGIVRGDDGDLPVTLGFFTRDGSAINGLDYTSTSNILFFAAQERLKFVSIPILNNGAKGPSKTFQVVLTNPVGVTLGAQSTTTVTIANSNQGFQFGSATYLAGKDAGAARITVLRGTAVTNSTITVDFATTDGTATNGVSYMATNGTLAFGPGELAKMIYVPIINNGIKEPTRKFIVALTNPSAGSSLGAPATTTVSILDTDPGLGFERTSYTTGPGEAASFSVTIVRGNDWFLSPITIDYATTNASAIAGLDFQAVAGTLKFEQNETVKNINIPILRNPPGSRTFRVVLTNPTGGATLANSSTTVTIAGGIAGTFASVATPYDAALSIRQEGDLNILSWSGGGLLQRADHPSGPWQTLTAATNPYTLKSPVPSTFYRVTNPRSVQVYIPSGYDGQTPMPLVMCLHAYTNTGQDTENYLQFQPLADSRGFLYCHPDSSIDQAENMFWNATDAACDFWNTGVDDAGYLQALILEIAARFSVDRKRVYLVGHSNGGFMAYRMACQSADLVAGIASLAGVTFLDPNRCQPSQPVNILHIQGTADEIVFYSGGELTTANPAFPFPGNTPAFPGALRDIQIWAGHNGASNPVTDATASLDLTSDVAGLDTVVTRYMTSQPGGAVELWTINGGTHSPGLSSDFSARVIDWLLAHPKP
jgi:polyhydroxybutyrate depolymerase